MKWVVYLFVDRRIEAVPDPATWGLAAWGVEIVRVYQEEAIAATPSSHRPHWQQLLQDLQTQLSSPAGDRVTGMIVRSLADLGETLTDVGDRLSQLHTLDIPVFELSAFADSPVADSAVADSPQDNTPFPAPVTIASFHARHDLHTEQRRRRIQQGHARNRHNALPPPGKAPYGYRRSKTGYIIDRTTAPVIQDFFEQFLLYGSVRGAVRYLAKRYNKKISVSTAHRWLSNPVYRGDLAYQDGHQIRDAHPALISRDEAAQVDRLLRRNRRLPPRSASAPRSLAGLVSCATCHSPMTITRVTQHQRQREYLYLRPRTCPQQPKCAALSYDAVLAATIERICADLSQAIAGVPLPDLNQVKQGMQQAIAAKQAILEQLPALVDSGILDTDTLALRSYALRTEIAAAATQLAQLPPVDLLATAQTLSIPQFWFDLSEAERRAYLREFIQAIQVIRQGDRWELRLLFSFQSPRPPE